MTKRADPVAGVETTDWFLSPGAAPDLDEPPFAITELPKPSERTMLPRGPGDAPTRAAVRLVALKVHDNKALFKAAVRLDALVLTTSSDGQVVASRSRSGSLASRTATCCRRTTCRSTSVKSTTSSTWPSGSTATTPRGSTSRDCSRGPPRIPKPRAPSRSSAGWCSSRPKWRSRWSVAAVATVVRVASELVQAAVGKEIGLAKPRLLGLQTVRCRAPTV